MNFLIALTAFLIPFAVFSAPPVPLEKSSAQIMALSEKKASSPEVMPWDPAVVNRRRQEVLVRWFPEIEVEKISVTPENCVSEVKKRSRSLFFQMFLKRERMVRGIKQEDFGLVPLEFDYVFRTSVDVERLRPSCSIAKELIVVSLPQNLRREKSHEKDFVSLLGMADDAQTKVDPRTANRREIVDRPTLLDLFGVVTGEKPAVNAIVPSASADATLPPLPGR